MTVDLPEPLAAIVRKRVEERGYPSVGEYIAALIRADDTDEWWASLTPEERREHDRLQDRITKSLTTGGPDLSLEEVRAEAMRRIQGRRAQRATSPDSP